MSESAPVYISCASGNNAFADCLVMTRGDMVRLVGPSEMDFTPLAARQLALTILDLIGDDHLPKCPENDVPPLRRARKLGGDFQHTGTIIGDRPDQVETINTPQVPVHSGDEIVDAVRARLLERSLAGQRKYGAKMTRDDLSLKDWIKHALEECLDQAVYLERLKRDVERTEDDGK